MSDILYDNITKYAKDLHLDFSGEELAKLAVDNNFQPDALNAIG